MMDRSRRKRRAAGKKARGCDPEKGETYTPVLCREIERSPRTHTKLGGETHTQTTGNASRFIFHKRSDERVLRRAAETRGL